MFAILATAVVLQRVVVRGKRAFTVLSAALGFQQNRRCRAIISPA
jgi:hypothetical protein